jgi:hypothetical protein
MKYLAMKRSKELILTTVHLERNQTQKATYCKILFSTEKIGQLLPGWRSEGVVRGLLMGYGVSFGGNNML